MRHDLRNSSPLPAKTSSANRGPSRPAGASSPHPSSTRTESSTPGRPINLYGLTSAGKKVWQFTTGGIIDTAPARSPRARRRILRWSSAPATRPCTASAPGTGVRRTRKCYGSSTHPASGEGCATRVLVGGQSQRRTRRHHLPGATPGRSIRHQPKRHPEVGAPGRECGVDGAGDGRLRVTYWGSVDQTLFALEPGRQPEVETHHVGLRHVVAGIGHLGTITRAVSMAPCMPSPDGSVKWKFATGDHIYRHRHCSRMPTARQQIIIGSTDGVLYSLTPGGQVRWAYDTGALIRSSLVIGRTPTVRDRSSTSARPMATSTRSTPTTGRRWAFDTTSTTPESPPATSSTDSLALGTEGVYLGSQDGTIWGCPTTSACGDGVSTAVGQQAELPAMGCSCSAWTPVVSWCLQARPSGSVRPVISRVVGGPKGWPDRTGQNRARPGPGAAGVHLAQDRSRLRLGRWPLYLHQTEGNCCPPPRRSRSRSVESPPPAGLVWAMSTWEQVTPQAFSGRFHGRHQHRRRAVATSCRSRRGNRYRCPGWPCPCRRC